MNERDLIQALLDAIGSGDDEQTEAAAQACSGLPGLLPALRPLLSDADNDRRWWAVRTLALIENREAIPLIIERLTDPDEATRCAAAIALGKAGAAASIPALVARLADASGWVRDSAADGLALIGEASLPALVEAMRDPRDGVRVRAASALRRILAPTFPRGTPIGVDSSAGRAVVTLFEALNDSSYLVHKHAYDALDSMGLLDTILLK